jgi:two-component system sensor histidine kinase BaeS
MFRPVIFGIGKLGLRLTLAFLGVALTAIIVMSGLTELSTGRDINSLVMEQEEALGDAVAVASGAAYGHAGWEHANLGPVLALVSGEGAAAQVRDMNGNLVQATPGFSSFRASHVFTKPVVMRGQQVGSVAIKFGQDGLGSAISQFEAERVRASVGAAGIVALIALVVSLLISRQITSPLERVLAIIRARGAGDRSVRIGEVRGTGVVSELAVALNESSDAIDKRDRLQKNLVANIAHELRTPVAILQASHEAMLDGVTAPTSENLWSLRDEVLRLARMIEDLQRLAAAEAAALQLKLVPQDLSVIAAQAAASLSDSFGAASVNLVRRLNPVSIMCDPDRMREVITNLLTNALKFTPAGGTVEIETRGDDRGSARLLVSDTGIGIPSDELPRVTERFFRGQRSSEMATGSGIGLTIVAELVRAQHGTLYISSEPGNGTQAIITIPGANEPETGRWRRPTDQAKRGLIVHAANATAHLGHSGRPSHSGYPRHSGQAGREKHAKQAHGAPPAARCDELDPAGDETTQPQGCAASSS